MRVSKQLLTKSWLPVLTLALTVVCPLPMVMGQIVVPATENISDSTSATGTATEWLNKAREAITKGDLQLADHYVQIADELYQQRPAGSELNYTPQMARRELAALSNGAPAATNPVMQSTPLPKEFPTQAVSVPQVSVSDMETAAKQAMLKARQALALGYTDTATQMLQSARQYQVNFDSLGDSPRQIELMIFHQNNLEELAKAQDPGFNMRAATFLLQQADSLMTRYNDFETASSLIDQAKKFPVEFAAGPQHPDQMMAAIASAHQASPAADDTKSQMLRLMSQAQLAVDQRQWQEAKQLVDQAKGFQVPDSQFAEGETRPWQLDLQIQQGMNMQTITRDADVVQTNFADDNDASRVVHADYDPNNDTTHNAQVSGSIPAPATDSVNRLARRTETNPIPSRGMQLYNSGLQALDNNDMPRAKEYFELAWRNQDQLDSTTRQAIQDHLSKMPSEKVVKASGQEDPFADTPEVETNAVRESQQAMFRKLQGEVFKERASADRLLESNPREALEKMTMIRSRIAQSEIDPNSRRPLLTIIDRDITEMQRYIDKNLPEIKNDEMNQSRLEDVEIRRQRNMDVESQIAQLVEDFNRLIDEERFAEAEMVARQAQELAPRDDVVVALTEKAKFASRMLRMTAIKDRKERGVWETLEDVEKGAIPLDGDTPYIFDKERFGQRAALRRAELGLGNYSSESERKIWNLLKNQKVQGDYQGTLASAVEQLSRQAGVNIIFDNVALAAEGVETDRSVNVPIHTPISLESALRVILESAGLVFVVKDEVIKVTSVNAQQKDVEPRTYYVGDLVTPITNFSSTMQMNFMQPGGGGMGQPGFNNNQLGGNPMTMPIAQQNTGGMNAVAMAQQMPGGLPGGFGLNGYGGGGAPQTGTPTYSTIGPQRLGGVTEADFQPLIELVKSTINPDGWDDTSGDGTIQAFVPNLSLIVSQTQEVQDQIQDLLNKLRELNDVQIVIEVRFITLQDNFFEQVGVDFDFEINDRSGLPNPIPDQVPGSVVVGNNGSTGGVFSPTADLDIGFNQDSFASAIPQFGGFDPGTAANFGFAILSDIEVFFLIQASKGDTRSNIMQAPTVTMFNGQSASVTDGALRPFVTSVTPVVGDFAVAQQPVITILPDGTSLNVQAVVSNDRQFVRMTLVPFFSQVQEVQTFTFDGTTTTRRSSDSLLDDLIDTVAGNDDNGNIDEFETETQGVTIQLPVLATTSVSTVVSVPDGGTVLMGGIKRMSEGRTERGVPFLSNIPYVNRLFKNVGIGRDTQNLMMMVTPTIIIQEEEEKIQVGDLGN